MPWQLYAMAMLTLIGAIACWHDFEPDIKRGLLTGFGIVGGSACVGLAALILRSI